MDFKEVIYLRMNHWSVEHFLTIFSPKLDSTLIKTLEKHFFTLSECFSNVLITGESNLDERNGKWSEEFILKEITS